MTTIKTTINGAPFELEIADGLNVEFSADKLKVTKAAPLALYQRWGQQIAAPNPYWSNHCDTRNADPNY